MAKNCMADIMNKLTSIRSLNAEDAINVDYDKNYFILPEAPKHSEQEMVTVLRK